MILHVYCSDTGQLDLENMTTEFVGDNKKRLQFLIDSHGNLDSVIW